MAQTWSILQLLYSCTPTTPAQTTKTISSLTSKVDKLVVDGETDVRPASDVKVIDNDKDKDTSTGEFTIKTSQNYDRFFIIYGYCTVNGREWMEKHWY